MNMKKCDSNSQTKVLAVSMFAAGLFIWLMSDSERPIIHDIIRGLGIYLFVLGAANLNGRKAWCELSPERRRTKIVGIVVLAVLLVLGLTFFTLR
ncbi:hypothetical protein HOI83_04670 [Candidatus Uhrbacteria bacterium]|jgi:hypothetical protein|nr:hypothetical protein [Candidatus Uhrbacteria bacterium]